MNEKITTKVLPGFMELLPADQIVFDRMKAVIQSTFERYGYVPLDTPVIERAEVLLAKAGGETEKQIYRFNKGDTDLALRFDLTVPLARYVSEHLREITFPFRRCHVGKVYRGESPQKGRYREFYQCDIDIIGFGSLSLMNDAEIPSVIYQVFRKLDFGPFVIRISNRKLITGLLVALGAKEQSVDVMRIIDKIEKVGKPAVEEMLKELGLAEGVTSRIFEFLEIRGSTLEIIDALRKMSIDNEQFQFGINELDSVMSNIQKLGVPLQYFGVDLSIARGLDYYTGTVYETVMTDHPNLGSVCSGGRYDNLAEKYTDNRLPGVGISIGLTRLFSQLKDAGLISAEQSTPTSVLVVPFVDDLSVPLAIASSLRNNGVPTEVYFEEAKFNKKMAYADKLGIPFVVIVGGDELSSGLYTVKNMKTREQVKVPIDRIYDNVQLKT